MTLLKIRERKFLSPSFKYTGIFMKEMRKHDNIIEDLNPGHTDSRKCKNRNVYCQVFLTDLQKCAIVEVQCSVPLLVWCLHGSNGNSNRIKCRTLTVIRLITLRC